MEERLQFNPFLLQTQGAPAPTTTTAPAQIPFLSPQETTTSPTEMVNQAVAAGIKQGQKEDAVQQITNDTVNFGKQVQQENEFRGLPRQQAYDLGNIAMGRRLVQRIVDGTQKYMDAQAAGDTAGMQYWHDYVDASRTSAGNFGVDVSQLGADRSLAQKQAVLDLANDNYYAEILNTKDSGTFYNERFDFYKSIGLSDNGADKQAYNDAKEYSAKRLRTLQDELLANGINPRTGAIGNYGVQLISLMRDEDPDSITPFVTMMPGPSQDYVVRMSEYQKGNAFDRSLQAANNDFEHRRDLQSDSFRNALQLAQIDAETKRYLADTDSNTKKYIAGLQIPKKGTANKEMTKEQETYFNRLDNAFAEYQKAVASPNTSFDEKYAAQGKFNDVIDEMKEKGIVRDDDPLLNEYRSYGYQQDQIIRALYDASKGRVPLSRADNKSGTD